MISRKYEKLNYLSSNKDLQIFHGKNRLHMVSRNEILDIVLHTQ